MNLEPLLQQIITEDDRRQALDYIDNMCQDLYKTDWSLQASITKNEKFGPSLTNILPQESSAGVLDKLLRDIKQQIEKLPELKVILAINPSDKLLVSISDFAEKKYGSKQILNIEIDHNILGGVIFISNGKYTDLSVANKFKNEFENGTIKDLFNT